VGDTIHPDHPGADRFALALKLQIPDRCIVKFRLDMSVSRLSHEKLSRRRGSLQTRGDIDGISQHRVVRDWTSSDVADKGRTRGDSRAKMKVFTVQPIHASENP